MAYQAKKIELLTVSLEAKPGALAKVYAAFRDARVNVIASWAYQMGPGEAKAHFYAPDLKTAKDALTKLGKTPVVEPVCWVEGTDAIGSYLEPLDKIAKAGLNVEASTAFAIDDRFATVIFSDPPEAIEKLCRAVGA
jgi:hypothetical protein